MNRKLWNKMKESLVAVLPITGVVLLLHGTVAPMSGGMLALFLVGAALLILGMGLFTLGADLAMMPMGEQIGAKLTQSRRVILLALVCFAMGIMITVAEPDLQVLARQVPAVPNQVLIGAVALGVGCFLVVALLRILFRARLAWMLLVCYLVVFGLAAFVPAEYLAVAFDSGGVTTGPITVPFIMALGIGMAAVRGGRSAQEDSFGLVALCSVGPILSVLLLGMFFPASPEGYVQAAQGQVHTAGELIALFAQGFPIYAKEVGLALTPIVAAFVISQIWLLKLPRRQCLKVVVGVIYTYMGLVCFLTGVNVGFMPAGSYLGGAIAGQASYLLIPLGMVIGFFIVMAEPAVHVLTVQVEEISGGAISRRAMLLSLSLGVAASIGLAMVRVTTGASIWFFLLPGYAVALGLSFFVPPIFTAIAFDSGGVASGPMTATFLLPFAMGACEAVGGDILTDAFGIVAMVAMTPLLTIQVLGLFYSVKQRISGRSLEEAAQEAAIAPQEELEILEFDVDRCGPFYQRGG